MSRVLAGLVDAFVVAGLGLAVQFGAGGVRLLVTGPPFRLPDLSVRLSGLCGWTIALLYLTGSWVLTGSTVGGRLLGLRVVTGRSGGLPGVLRALARAALCLVFPLGLLWIPVSRRRASVQDLVLATTVRYDRM
ncbi:RDD family protein [Streptomyces dioscori]|uniref:RDD family protein n=1 Tax=Streptomyces dioscori TaxID=2109333 RepID=A0A2P8Q3T4_9ACTN|nr:RDD family protein [Streptomyces dioscori]PSM40919.1 RDD family protein [Streptomyces dioscori]